jgi:hypothetical protein
MPKNSHGSLSPKQHYKPNNFVIQSYLKDADHMKGVSKPAKVEAPSASQTACVINLEKTFQTINSCNLFHSFFMRVYRKITWETQIVLRFLII